jgi:polyisoprenoid-binding protein YceI
MAMTKRRWALAAGIAVPLAALAAVYLLFFTPDSPERLKLSANGSAAGTPSGPSLEGRWQVAEGSVAGYRVREKLAQLPAPSDAVGRTSAITGGLTAERNGDKLTIKDVRFEADLTKLASDQQKRDNKIHTLGLESDKFPTATFAIADPFEVGANEIGTAPAGTKIKGDLTIHGVTKRVTIPVDVQRNGDKIEVAGSLTFPFSQFGMQPPSIPPLVSVTDNATMEFDLLFAKAST